MNAQYAQYLQWIGVGCTAIVGLCLVVMALLQSRPRRIRSWALVAVAVLEAAAAYLLISTPSITLSVVGWRCSASSASFSAGSPAE
jgi:hypothetical protein